MKISRVITGVLIATSLLGIVINPNRFETIQKSSRSSHFVFPPNLVQHLVLGFKLPIADIIWVRLIQDLDYKDSRLANIRKGWVYRMADIITDLDKRYRIVYISAGTILSVMIHDIEGASLIFEKAALNVTDWSLFYRAGYHFLYEAHDCSRAAYFYSEAAQYGAPYWVKSLVARIYDSKAQYDLALATIDESIEQFKGTEYEKYLQGRRQEILQKSSGLNSSKTTTDQQNLTVQNLCR